MYIGGVYAQYHASHSKHTKKNEGEGAPEGEEEVPSAAGCSLDRASALTNAPLKQQI
jgi:hypothetical protein